MCVCVYIYIYMCGWVCMCIYIYIWQRCPDGRVIFWIEHPQINSPKSGQILYEWGKDVVGACRLGVAFDF